MYCLKCGKETENEQVFCAQCLLTMEQYPVKPGTHITLPHRKPNPQPKKTPRRRILTAEDQVRRLKGTVRVLTACLLAACLMLGILSWLHFRPSEQETGDTVEPIGQNYTVENT